MSNAKGVIAVGLFAVSMLTRADLIGQGFKPQIADSLESERIAVEAGPTSWLGASVTEAQRAQDRLREIQHSLRYAERAGPDGVISSSEPSADQK